MKKVLIYISFALFLCGVAWAADAAPGAAVPDAPAASSPSQTKAPAVEGPSLTFNFQQRIRTEDWNNILDYNSAADDERRQMRYRTRLWMNYDSAPVQFSVGLVDEITKKYALKPADVTADRLNTDEIIFETLYLKLKKLIVPGLSLSVGRQDIQRGEGFLLFDGTSGDGSRTSYFNAVDLAYEQKKNKVELIGILDPRRDRFLGIVHDQHKYMNEWNEQAIALYDTNRQLKNTDVDAYYFYKKEVKDYRAATNAQFQPDRHISTLGARVVQRYPQGLSVTGEFAGQWGAQHANLTTGVPAKDIRAWGGYAYVKKTFAASWKPYVLAGYWALSGDDPNNTKTLNGFDPLFSRWPKWSELYIYSEVPERGVAYWTNNRMLQLEAGANPVKALTLRGTFYEEQAFHPYTKNPKVFGAGTHRGENYQVRADYVFNQHWRCHALYENFAPGDFYLNKGDSFFVQSQVVYTFSASVLHAK